MDTDENKEPNFTEGEKVIQESLKELFKVVKYELLRLNREVENLKKWYVNTHIDQITNKLDKLINENTLTTQQKEV
jgi:hypothetical protein